MRIRNKELRQRWHRKEQRVKELIAEAKQNKADGGTKAKAAKAEKPAAKAVEKKAVEKKPVAAKKPKVEAEAAPKPKKAPVKKKADDAAAE